MINLSDLKELGGWLGTALFAVTSALLYFFPARRKELDEATAKLIKTLQETVSALENDLNIYKAKTLQLEEHQKENIAKISALDTERQLLKDFLNGRDKATIEFQASSIKLTSETNDMVRNFIDLHTKVIDGLTKNNASTERLVEILDKHFINVEKAALT